MSQFYQWKLMTLKRMCEDLVKTSFPSLEPFFTISLHLKNMICVVSHLKKKIEKSQQQCETQGVKNEELQEYSDRRPRSSRRDRDRRQRV
jgi:hypothetical protein